MTNDIKNEYECNDDIDYEPKFERRFSLYSDSNRDPLTVLTFALKTGNKNGANIISGLTFLWDSGATDSMIKRIHTRP